MTIMEAFGLVRVHVPRLDLQKRRLPVPPPQPVKCNGLACCIRGTCDESKKRGKP